MSNACSDSSNPPAAKTSPPPVTMAPPRLIDPQSRYTGASLSLGIEPRGVSQRFAPEARSTASTVPQGGGLQGTPSGDSSGSRIIPYGVPFWAPYSAVD